MYQTKVQNCILRTENGVDDDGEVIHCNEIISVDNFLDKMQIMGTKSLNLKKWVRRTYLPQMQKTNIITKGVQFR